MRGNKEASDYSATLFLTISVLLFTILLLNPSFMPLFSAAGEDTGPYFNGKDAFIHVERQMDFGTRIPESEGHSKCVDYIKNTLKTNGLDVRTQQFTGDHGEGKGLTFTNIIGRLEADEATEKRVILGAHYDTRPFSDRDDEKTSVKPDYGHPVPGANDGASGVAVLLELAKVMGEYNLSTHIDFIFFDGEDYGTEIESMLYGSTFYAENLSQTEVDEIEFLVLLDMIGDEELTIYREMNSDYHLMNEIWSTAKELGVNQFVNTTKYSILDDHIPFRDRGVQVVDLIDFDYPNESVNYWHTPNDTLDKVSSESLLAVGKTVEVFLGERLGPDDHINGNNSNGNGTNGNENGDPSTDPNGNGGDDGAVPGSEAPVTLVAIAIVVMLKTLKMISKGKNRR